MTIETPPELEAEAARVLAMILHPETPVPVPIAADMLQDAGAEDRDDVAYELFRATGNMLLKELGDDPAGNEPILPPENPREQARQIFVIAWHVAAGIAQTILGQTIPADWRTVTLNERLAGVPSLGVAGITTTIKTMALKDWAARLPKILNMLQEVEQHAAEDLTPKP